MCVCVCVRVCGGEGVGWGGVGGGGGGGGGRVFRSAILRTECASPLFLTLPPLMRVQPSVPRVARIGDSFLAGVILRVIDDSAAAGTAYSVVVTATVTEGGSGLRLVAPAPLELTVAAGEDVPARFAFETTGTAVTTARLQFVAAVVVGGVTVSASTPTCPLLVGGSGSHLMPLPPRSHRRMCACHPVFLPDGLLAAGRCYVWLCVCLSGRACRCVR